MSNSAEINAVWNAAIAHAIKAVQNAPVFDAASANRDRDAHALMVLTTCLEQLEKLKR